MTRMIAKILKISQTAVIEYLHTLEYVRCLDEKFNKKFLYAIHCKQNEGDLFIYRLYF